MFDGSDKYKAIVDIIESNFNIIEKHLSEQSNAVVLVFRGRVASSTEDL
jgi:hypothetical protein